MTFIHTAAGTEAPSTSEGSLDAWGWVRGSLLQAPTASCDKTYSHRSSRTGYRHPKANSHSTYQGIPGAWPCLMCLNGTEFSHSTPFKIQLIHYLYHSNNHSDNDKLLHLFAGLHPRGWNNYILVISVSLVPTTNLSIYWVLHKCLLTIKWSELTPHQALLQRRRQFSCAWFFPLWKHISLHAGHPLENGSL